MANCPTKGPLSYIKLKESCIMASFKQQFEEFPIYVAGLELRNKMVAIGAYGEYKCWAEEAVDW